MYVEAQQENAALRQQFARNNLLPEWKNPHCYLVKQPEHPNRLASKAEVCKAFNLSTQEYKLALDLDQKVRNKARLLRALVAKQAIKLVDGKYMVNPAIRLAQGWWSPYMYGVFLVDWENEHWTDTTVDNMTTIDSMLLENGAAFASNVQL